MPDVMGDLLSRSFALALGLAVLVYTTVSLMRTVVIPRALRSSLSDGITRLVIRIAKVVARVRKAYPHRDAVLATVGPTVIVLQLLAWLVLYLIAYGLLIYSVSGRHTLSDAMRQSGSSLLTLGFAAGDQSKQTLIDFVAAATGPIVIALLIGFLPSIYSTYLDREQEVALLGASGGEPAWGPELLARLSMRHSLDFTGRVFGDWAQWAARLRLTHTTYPVLVWVRSSRASRHYIASLIAVLDAAAMQVSLSTSAPHKEAYFMLLQGSQTLETLYAHLYQRRNWRAGLPMVGRSIPEHDESVHLPSRSQEMLKTQVAAYMDASNQLTHEAALALSAGENQPVTLPRKDFDEAVEMLRRTGYPIDNDMDSAWKQFQVYRGRYEYIGYAICALLDAVPAPWTGERTIPTETMWPTLVASLVDQPVTDADQQGEDEE